MAGHYITFYNLLSRYIESFFFLLIIIIINPNWSRFIPINKGGRIYNTLAAISPTTTLHLPRFMASSLFREILQIIFIFRLSSKKLNLKILQHTSFFFCDLIFCILQKQQFFNWKLRFNLYSGQIYSLEYGTFTWSASDTSLKTYKKVMFSDGYLSW